MFISKDRVAEMAREAGWTELMIESLKEKTVDGFDMYYRFTDEQAMMDYSPEYNENEELSAEYESYSFQEIEERHPLSVD